MNNYEHTEQQEQPQQRGWVDHGWDAFDEAPDYAFHVMRFALMGRNQQPAQENN